ncbi:MAG: type II toxin-antitoxin system VapC family toxin [Candidatus Bathyarchaeota archaeon]|nr:type II toxin-antitoxin system VapC family toxin [Candidatus Bathyarchaeota archaeon]
MRFVDANVFIYVLVKSPKEDYEIAKKILKRIEGGEEAATSLAVIQEIVDWLEYNNREKEVKSFLTAVNSYLTMNKLAITWEDFLAALDNVDKFRVDFVDALTLRVMQKNKINEVYSNDKDFDRVPWVKRIWE